MKTYLYAFLGIAVGGWGIPTWRILARVFSLLVTNVKILNYGRRPSVVTPCVYFLTSYIFLRFFLSYFCPFILSSFL